MARAWVLAPLLLLGAAGCSEEEAAAAVSQETYDEEAARLCAQHGPSLSEAYVETRPDSDAEEAAFYRTDVIPRARAIVNRLADLGFPPDRAEAYAAGLNQVLAAAGELEADPFTYIDRRQAGRIAPDDDLVVRIRTGFEAAGVPC